MVNSAQILVEGLVQGKLKILVHDESVTSYPYFTLQTSSTNVHLRFLSSLHWVSPNQTPARKPDILAARPLGFFVDHLLLTCVCGSCHIHGLWSCAM